MASVLRIVPRLLENAALEGRCGVSVEELLNEKVGDDVLRRACWRGLVASAMVQWYVGPKQEPSAISFLESIKTSMTLEEAIKMKLWVVACEDLRMRALHVARASDVSAQQLLILERVAKARMHGVSMMQLTESVSTQSNKTKKEMDAEIRAVHHVLDGLLSQKLVVKKMLQVGKGVKRKRFNVIVLERFANAFDHAASFPGSLLEEDLSWKANNVAQLISFLKTNAIEQCVLSDAVRDLALQKHKFEAFKNYIIAEGQRQGPSFPIEIFTAVVGSDTKRKLWCVKLRETKEVENPLASFTPLTVESSILFQIHRLIYDVGTGITTPEIRNHFEIPGAKTTYRLLNTTTSAYPVRMTKVIVGRNSVFKIFPTEATTLELPPPSNEELPVAPTKRKRVEETLSGNPPKRRVHGHSLKKNSAAMAPLMNASDDTATLRSNHIMERLQKERIVSLYSLRSSIIEMENYHFENTNVQFIVGHRVDTRSIMRILDVLEEKKKLTQQQCEIPLKTTATPGTRIIHIVKAIGVTEAELNSYLVRHSRDTRIQLLKTKAFAHPNMSVSEADGRVQPVDPTKITYLLKTKLSEVHKDNLTRIKQARTLGMSYGMMYRCHLFHRLVFEYLSNNPLPLATLLQDTTLDPTISVLFSLDHVLQSVKVRQYVRIFGIGHVLSPQELTTVEQALQRDIQLHELDAGLRSKLTHRQNRRCMRMLNTLKTLRLIGSYRLHLEQLLKLMHDDGHGLDVPQLVEHTMYDRSTSSLLVFHRHVRIMLDDPSPQWQDMARAPVNATRHQYSFGHNLPLQLTLDCVNDVEMYWEALQCCSLESLSYSSGLGQIHTFPKPVAFRHVNIFAPISWTSLTQSIRYDKRKDRERAAVIPGSGRITRSTRPRRDYIDRALYPKGKRKVVGKRKRRSVQVEHVEFTPEEDQAMVAAFFAQLETNWHVAVPTDMQKDGEEVAIRSPSVYRVNFSIVAVSRLLQRPTMPTKGVVRRRLDELLDQIAAKQSYLALTKRVFGTKEFSEELEIQRNPRLAALLVRVLMIVLTPDSSYVQMAAEHLLVMWNRTEINTVWRYLWLRGWIVPASTPMQRNLHRGYVHSHKLSLLWRDGVSFPLSLFEEAAEHASVLEEIEEEDVVVEVCPPLLHSAFVLGSCTFQLDYNRDRCTEIKTSIACKKRKHRRRTDGTGDGIAGHLNKLQPCRDPWTLTAHFSPATADEEWWLVFSTSDSRPWKKPKRTPCNITESDILTAIGNAKENGLCLSELIASLSTYDRSFVHATTLELVHQNKLVAVHGYDAPRYILPQYQEFWYICAYTVAPNGNTVYDTQSPGLLPHAWLQLNGQANTIWWARIQRKIVQYIIASPGSDEDVIWCYMEKILPLEEVRMLLAQLSSEDIIYARIVEKSSVSLFSGKTNIVCIPTKPLPEIDRGLYIVRYFPQPDCIEKFGMLCRDEN